MEDADAGSSSTLETARWTSASVDRSRRPVAQVFEAVAQVIGTQDAPQAEQSMDQVSQRTLPRNDQPGVSSTAGHPLVMKPSEVSHVERDKHPGFAGRPGELLLVARSEAASLRRRDSVEAGTAEDNRNIAV